MRLRAFTAAVLLCVSAWLSLPAIGRAGGGCEAEAMAPEAVARGFEAGLRVFQRLDELGAEAALLARVGSDLSKHGLRFSHVGLVVRDHPAGRHTVVHLLNECGTDRLDLYDQGLANFFLDGPFSYDAWIVVPDAALQRRLVEVSQQPLARRLLAHHYNLVAPPAGRVSQNSNGWLLELLVAALDESDRVRDRTQVAGHPLLRRFQPDEVRVTLLDRLGSGLQANANPGEQPWCNRRRGRAEVVTVRSIVHWLRSLGRVQHEEIVEGD